MTHSASHDALPSQGRDPEKLYETFGAHSGDDVRPEGASVGAAVAVEVAFEADGTGEVATVVATAGGLGSGARPGPQRSGATMRPRP